MQEYRDISSPFREIAGPWIVPAVGRIVAADPRFGHYEWVEASADADLQFATDYHAVASGRADVAFRGRDVMNCHRAGFPVRQQTLRMAGDPTERDKVRGINGSPGHGDLYVTAWCLMGARELEAAVVVDLERFRAVPADIVDAHEDEAASNHTFRGIDVYDLLRWNVVVDCYPDDWYFRTFRQMRVV